MNARRIVWSIVGVLSLSAVVRALEPIAILSPSDVPAGYTNSFGWSVAVSGNYVVVGAPHDPFYNGDATGAVYVFRRVGSTWVEQAKLTVFQPSFQDQLGWSVAIDGDVIVAGAPRWDFVSCGAQRAGAAYVFRRDDRGTPDDPTDDTWLQQGKLTVADPQLAQILGMSVAISGDVVVVGSGCAGAVQVFRWNGNDWNHEGSLTGSNMEGRYGFGSSVAVDGDRIVSGAYGNHTGPGAAYVFVRNETTWTEETILVPTDHTTPDSFGWAVSLSSDNALVGAIGTSDAGPASGSAYVFVRQGPGTWAEQAKVTACDATANQDFGYSVAIDGNLVVVSKTGDPLALLFRCEDSGWVQTSSFFGGYADVPAPVAINGKYALVSTSVYVVRDKKSLQDYAAFQNCFTANVGGELSATCQPFDLAGDGRVDLADFEEFVGSFVGAQN